MKRCPRCSQTYTDDQLNFCLNDGEFLISIDIGQRSASFADDSPPTIAMDPARVTNPTNWPPVSSPPAQWQQPSAAIPQFGTAFPRSQDQTLPTISLILGIASLVMVCCYGGIWLGLPALAVGFVGLKNANNNPTRYGGSGLAIAGMITGGVTLLIFLVQIIIVILSMLAR